MDQITAKYTEAARKLAGEDKTPDDGIKVSDLNAPAIVPQGLMAKSKAAAAGLSSGQVEGALNA